MKLELKHISAYYAHDLKVQYYDDERGSMKICQISELRKEECTINDNLYQYEVEFYEFKPILRPIKDCLNQDWKDKLLTAQDEKTEDEWFLEAIEMEHNFIYADFQNLTYRTIEFLIANYFDIFGLIKSRCAIDINTLNNAKQGR